MIERVRFEGEMASLGIAEPQRERELPVSPGEFGGELARYAKLAGVPDAVFWLLQRSPTFRNILKTLDSKYLQSEKVPDDWVTTFAPNEEGVFTKGPKKGGADWKFDIRFKALTSAPSPVPMR